MPFIVVFLTLFLSVELRAEWFSDGAAIMGTEVRVELWHSETPEAKQAIEQVMLEIRRIDKLMSPFKPESELSRLNRSGVAPVKVSRELFQVIEAGYFYGDLSEGAFDISFAALAKHYDYRKGLKPSSKENKQALARINYKNISLNRDLLTVQFKKTGMSIDLGGIAKGYAVDRGIALLKKLDIKHAVVTAGGDSRLLGDRRGKPWMMGVRHPRQETEFIAALPLENMAISTSGDYERYFVDQDSGERIHHIINPKTGNSASELSSVTIIAALAQDTDALSTAVFVLGMQRGLALLNSLPGVEGVLVSANGGLRYSQGLEPPEL